MEHSSLIIFYGYGSKTATICPGDTTQKGFTLIELLVVITIVGILAAIAVPQYRHYRELAYDTQAESDLRNGIISQEAAYIIGERYVDCADAGCQCGSDLRAELCIDKGQLPGFRLSPSTSIEFSVQSGKSEGDYFVATAVSRRGSGTEFSFDSREGVVTRVSDRSER